MLLFVFSNYKLTVFNSCLYYTEFVILTKETKAVIETHPVTIEVNISKY